MEMDTNYLLKRFDEIGQSLERRDHALGAKTLFIEPVSPWENWFIESFNGKMRDEPLNREIFYTLQEATVNIEQWRREYNTIRSHRALHYRPSAPEAIRTKDLACSLIPAVAPITT
jgi:putative transposase